MRDNLSIVSVDKDPYVGPAGMTRPTGSGGSIYHPNAFQDEGCETLTRHRRHRRWCRRKRLVAISRYSCSIACPRRVLRDTFQRMQGETTISLPETLERRFRPICRAAARDRVGGVRLGSETFSSPCQKAESDPILTAFEELPDVRLGSSSCGRSECHRVSVQDSLRTTQLSGF